MFFSFNVVLVTRNYVFATIACSATDYDWNIGGGSKRNTFIKVNNILLGIDPNIHGFKTYYYGVGKLRK